VAYLRPPPSSTLHDNCELPRISPAVVTSRERYIELILFIPKTKTTYITVRTEDLYFRNVKVVGSSPDEVGFFLIDL
jgi:hypothetical protein